MTVAKRLGIPNLKLVGDTSLPRAAGIVFVAKDGDVLLLRRAATEKNFGGHWGLPGGKGENGETASDTAIRETREEIGQDIDPLASGLKVFDEVKTPNGMLFTTFVKPSEDKFVPTLDAEHSGYCWASLDMLPKPLHPSVERCLGEHIGVAADMSPEDWDGLRKGFAEWTREEQREPAHAHDARMAMDRNLYDAKGKRILGHDIMALDRAPSSRMYDTDGHLHLSRTPISKANVCEYFGHEIPDADKLGLDPKKLYRLLRDPEELSKAAKTSNGKQLLLGHVPVSADDPQKDKQVGSTGTDAEFEFPYLYNSLHLHDREGIDAIEAADKAAADDADPASKGAKELSSAYRYRADMTPGVFHGAKYDGVMRDIDFNHVALVPEGRAGADVVVGDAAITTKEIFMTKIVLSRRGVHLAGALAGYLMPKMAADSKLDISAVLAGVTNKNFKERKPSIITALKAGVTLAKDASIDDLTLLLDKLENQEVVEGADADPESGEPMSKEDMEKKAKDAAAEADEEEKKKKEASDKKAADKASARDAFLKGKLSATDKKAYDDMLNEDSESPEAEKNAQGKGEAVDKKAMDEAIRKTADDTATRVRREMNEIAEAREFVAPWAGKVPLAMDSAEAVYRAALDIVGVQNKTMHKDALKSVLEAQPKPGQARTLATDAAPPKTGFNSRWSEHTDRIGGA